MRFYDIFSKVPTVFVRYGFRFVKKDEVVRFEKSEDQIGVFISSEKPLRYVRITWDMPELAKDAYVLGDAFERGYGDLFWGKPEGRKLFWYAAFSDKVKTFAYGVKTGCSAICYWEVGGDGLSLVLDVQNGTLPDVQIHEVCPMRLHSDDENGYNRMIRYIDKEKVIKNKN